MNTGVKLSTYGAVLAMVFAGAWTTGSAIGPLGANAAGDTSDDQGGRAADHASPGATPAKNVAPIPPQGPPRQQQPAEKASATAARREGGTRAARTTADVAGLVVVRVANAPVPDERAGHSRETRAVAERKPATRQHHNGTGKCDQARRRQHDNHEVRGRGER
ncbi:hypothetical protein [Amycolatopsis sp. NPDC051903]|uniref:hypothetical protein n=1 Tax=Amycolatopsis sp. NPDC051903 TaxID=3363936 RepID=UPI0037982691